MRTGRNEPTHCLGATREPIPFPALDILDYTERHHPRYLESPKEWSGLKDNRSQVTESKKEIDRRNEAGGPAGSVFEV